MCGYELAGITQLAAVGGGIGTHTVLTPISQLNRLAKECSSYKTVNLLTVPLLELRISLYSRSSLDALFRLSGSSKSHYVCDSYFYTWPTK